MPTGLVRILDRDLKLAGIAKNGDEAWSRRSTYMPCGHSFATLLSKGGVQPRTAQAAMRHSSIDLTMKVYTDPKLLDIHGALDVLPALPLDDASASEQILAKATGTDDLPRSEFAPAFAPTPDKSSKSVTIAVKTAVEQVEQIGVSRDDASCVAVKRNNPLTSSVNGLQKVGATRFELATSTSRKHFCHRRNPRIPRRLLTF